MPNTKYTITVKAVAADLPAYSDILRGEIQTEEVPVTTAALPEGSEHFIPDGQTVTVNWVPLQNEVLEGYNVVYTDTDGVSREVS